MISQAAEVADTPSSGDQERCSIVAVCVGSPFIVRALPEADHLLLVEADQEKVPKLLQSLQPRRDVTVFVEVLAERNGTQVRWFRFNDPRMNGPVPEEAWREIYPNLLEIGEETLVGRCLEDLLNNWGREHEHLQRPLLHMHLRQGDPLAALGGLGSWLFALQEVALAMPGAKAIWAHPVDDWLSERGFVKDENKRTTWRRDPIAMQRILLQEKERQIAKFESQIACQAKLVQELQATNEQLSATLNQLQSAINMLTEERDHMLAIQSDLAVQRDAFLGERDEQRARADALSFQLKRLNDELDHLLPLIDTVIDQVASGSSQ